MSLRQFLMPYIAEKILGEGMQRWRRSLSERRRIAEKRSHVIQYFHQVDDPYSHLMLQVLPILEGKYDVQIEPYLVNKPSEAAAPEYEMLKKYARVDAERLAEKAGLKFKNMGAEPDSKRVAAAALELTEQINSETFVSDAAAVSAALWSGSLPPHDGMQSQLDLGNGGDFMRTHLEHYQSGTYFYAGEWYWGIDRLHFLEERLTQLGLRAGSKSFIFPPPDICEHPPEALPKKKQEIDFFLSFRSPYSYIATERVKKLADTYGAKLNLRFVLPMIMRNLPVPSIKGRYIVKDVAREARRYQIPFGRIADPVGRPVHRGYALLPWAISEGRGYEYCLSFMRHSWSRGVDAGKDSGMKRIIKAAGLNWKVGRTYLEDGDWQGIAEHNRLDLFREGIWGVPSFRVGKTATWGQDRLWLIEDALRNPTY